MASTPSQLLRPRYATLSALLREDLAKVEPSCDGQMTYYPCRVILDCGVALDAVYLAPELPYLRHWGMYPEDDKGRLWISLEWVQELEASPFRLPATFASQLYQHGQSGVGYFIFTILFFDGTQQTCISGSALDFVQYPPGKGPSDVMGVLPYEGKKRAEMVKAPRYFWCLYS